tara:strand:+ start:542 stop:1054 length:513 start_codon:yes stop_codon:yes gene_type:complete
MEKNGKINNNDISIKDEINMDKLIDETILNLKIISNIKENDKLITSKNIIEIDNPYILQGINRWYNNENRIITIKKLNEICENTFKITEYLITNEKEKKDKDNILKYNNNEIFQSLIIEMTNSINGIENLKNTYSKDILISSQLDILKKNMLMKIDKLNKLFSINITKYY